MAAFTHFTLPRTPSAPLERASSTNSLRRSASNHGLARRSSCGRQQRLHCRAQDSPADLSGFNDGRSADEQRRDLEALWAKQQPGEQLARSRSGLMPGGSWLSEAPTAALSSSDVDEVYEPLDGDAYTPFASAGLARSSSTLDDSLEYWTVGSPSSVVFGSAGLWGDLDQVYVILFGVGRTATEGIYSLRALTQEEGLPQDTVVAFESQDDAERYAALLEATMDHTPSVCPIDPQELLEFCLESGYSCRLEAGGSSLIPPDYNVGVTDWERSLRLREGQFSVLDNSGLGFPSHDLLGDLSRQLQQYSFPPYLPEGPAAAGLYSGSAFDPQSQVPFPIDELVAGSGKAAADYYASEQTQFGEGVAAAEQHDAMLSAKLDEALVAESLDDIKARLERLLPDD